MKKILLCLALTLAAHFLIVSTAHPQEKEAFRPRPAQGEPVGGTYVIGAEDVLYIHIWKEEALSRTIPVRTDGKISLPLIDEIQAAGLTPLELKERLTQEFKRFIDSPSVSVMVTEANSFKVYVSGQVQKPGVYRLRNETSLLQLIPMAGGFTEWANPKNIIIIRKESGQEKRIVLNYKKLLSGEIAAFNHPLRPGDIVIIP